MKKIIFILFLFIFMNTIDIQACSVVYFVDKNTGKIYVANNEDYWYDTKPYIQIIPKSNNKLARLWYGWENFAQGGINEAGLFFDGASTPEQKPIDGYHKPKGNLGDDILSNCKTVEDAIKLLEDKKIMLTNAHMIFGDASGKSVVVEWVDGRKQIIQMTDNFMIMTNFLLSAPDKGNYPCYRYNSIEERIRKLNMSTEELNMQKIGNVLGQAAQVPQTTNDGKISGTLYSTFINISDMKLVLVYKLENSSITKIDLKNEFENNKKRKIIL